MTKQIPVEVQFSVASPRPEGNQAVLPELRHLANKGFGAAGLCGPDAAAQNIIRLFLGLEPLAVEIRFDPNAPVVEIPNDGKAPVVDMKYHASLPDSYDITRVKREDTQALDKKIQVEQWAKIIGSDEFAQRTLHHIQTAYKSEETNGITLEFVKQALSGAGVWLKQPAIDIVFENIASDARAMVTRHGMQVEHDSTTGTSHLTTFETKRLERKPRLLAPAA